MADLSLLILSLLLSSLSPSSASDATSFVYAGCSQPKYTSGSSYEYNVDSLFTSLANAATFTSYANFTSASATPSSPVSGLFQCRADLPAPACSSCVRSSLSQLSSLCPSATGAAIQLDGCLLRYGNDSFLGRPDTTLLYKRCGPSSSSSTLIGMRDAALAAMQAAAPQGGTYRAAGAGSVETLSQCVGDLDAKECGDCVSSAVAQLRESCGLATSGDLYLGKCYARYWSSGGGGGGSHSGGGGNHDHAGKTVAILIGLLAGVVIIIIFVSFIRRSGDGKS